MTIAFRLFLVVVLIAPAFLVSDTLLTQGMLMAIMALVLLVIGVSIRPGEAAFFSSTIRPYALAAVLFAAVITLQLLPLPVASWRHPIWISAEAALGSPVWGSVTISPGDTAIALFHFLAACGVFTAATAVCIDRLRAEMVLFVLLAVSTGLALVLAVHNSGGFVFLGELGSTGPRAAIAFAASMATVLALAMLVYAAERFETRHSRSDFSHIGHIAALTASVTGFVLAIVTIAVFMPKVQMMPTLMGIATFLLIVGFRRAGVSANFGLLIPAAAFGIPALIAAQEPGGALDFSLRFASNAPTPILEAAQRAISDVGPLGAGAGTLGAIAPLYADPSRMVDLSIAPTTIASSVTGFGWPLTWLFLAAAILVTMRLIYGALVRGRDSFFTAAAASCLVAAIIEAFIDASLLHSTGLILVATVLGLGIAQSISRSAR